jgi:DNA invertase Pin-like site-specific DNA recombinase
MDAVAYIRVSTDEQNPQGQLQVIQQYAKNKGYKIIKIFEENISGSVFPLERPVFREMLNFCKKNNVKVIVMYDLTRFYRAKSPLEALNLLKELSKDIFIDFAREPQIEDPFLKELWDFIKSWFASYERAQISMRTKYGIMRVKNEGRLYHRPSILHYFASVLFNKDVSELTKEDLERAKTQFIAIVSKYWYDKRFKKHQIASILKDYETIFKKLYEKYPQAPTSYQVFWKIMSGKS